MNMSDIIAIVCCYYRLYHKYVECDDSRSEIGDVI